MHTTFHEIMTGQARLAGEERSRQILLDLAVDVPGLLRPQGDVEAAVTGRVKIGGWAEDITATGTMRISPVAARRIRYMIDFATRDGRKMHLDGWKSVSFARLMRSMTRLPVTITDQEGDITGEAQLRFDVLRSLVPMLASFRVRRAPLPERAVPGRVPAAAPPARAYMPSRWRGQPGRLEVWYTTLTDPATGTGIWLHHELVAPAGHGRPYTHGWAAVFPPDGAPALARFGPQPWHPPGGGAVFASGDVVLTATTLRGTAGARATLRSIGTTGARRIAGTAGTAGIAGTAGTESGAAAAGDAGPAGTPGTVGSAGTPGTRTAAGAPQHTTISWDLTSDTGGVPLFTFPRWAWEREALPGAQIVPMPSAIFRGTITYGDRSLTLDAARGGTARIFGHGNPHRWAWLHADLGGGDVCEVVAASSNRPGFKNLPPMPLVRLRVGGRDWPAGDPILHSTRFISRIRLPTWIVLGVAGDRRIRIQVTQPPERTIAVDYTDPDGTAAVCRNCERADAVITLQRRTPYGWQSQRRWRLDGTAHAEVGARD